MKCTGRATEADLDFNEYDFDVVDAIVEIDHISIDWIEYDEAYHAKLRSIDGGITYSGTFGCPKPHSECTMTATRYDSRAGTALLLSTWLQADLGREGACIFELDTGLAANQPATGKRITLAQLAKRVEALERDVAMLKARAGR